MLRFPARTATALGLLALLTACGTTVPGAQGGAASAGLGASPDGSLGGPESNGTSTSGGTTGTTTGSVAAGTGTGLTGGTGGTTGPGTGGTSGTTTTGAVVGGATGGVANAAPIKVGVFYLHGGNQVISQAFPGSSVSFGDGKREAQTVIDDLNAHGGAGGHKLVPSWIPIEATDNDAARQQKCQGAIQDTHPVALFAIFNLSAGLSNCVKQADVLMIDVALGAGDRTLYEQSKNHAFSPSQLDRDAEQKLVLGLAHQQGRLPAGKTVGLVYQSDDPMYPRVIKNTVEPLLRSWGVPFVEQAMTSGSDTSGMNSAVLKLKTSNVDTVVFSFGSGGIPEVLFMQAAEQQQYRPAYLMGDSTDTNFVGQSAPAEQIKRISGAGTYPLANVQSDQYPSSSGEKKCLALLNKTIGGYTNRYSSLTGTFYCELVWSFAAVASRVRGPVTSVAWSAAYHALGTAYAPVTTFATDLVPGRQDGASSYRTLGYGASCGCITYTSPIRRIP